jgi:hypothetical protein
MSRARRLSLASPAVDHKETAMTPRTVRSLASSLSRPLVVALPLALAFTACSSAPKGGASDGDPSSPSANGSSSGGGSSSSPSPSSSSGGNDSSPIASGSSGGSGSSSSGGETNGSSSGGAPAAGDGGGAAPNACDPIAAVTGTSDVPVTFEFNTGSTTPPAQTGGPITGTWRITKATLYLPSGLQGLVTLDKSTGTVNAWGVFTTDTFRIDANVNISVSSVLGSQPLTDLYDYQGSDTTSAAAFTIDSTCGDAGPPPFTATYSASGTTGSIDLALQVQGGTADMVLEATISGS